MWIISIHTAQCDDGDVRLVMGDTASEGQVQVCISKRWGTICRHGWSSDDAATVCRQLGYSDGRDIIYTCSIYFYCTCMVVVVARIFQMLYCSNS